MLRRQRSHRAVFAPGITPDDVDPPDATADPERNDRRLAMGAVLAALAPEHREALQLTRLMGFSTAEAARRLGISETALRVRVHRATRAANETRS
jgi:RNA polymerase sigma-70 factor (ECF subfamily)